MEKILNPWEFKLSDRSYMGGRRTPCMTAKHAHRRQLSLLQELSLLKKNSRNRRCILAASSQTDSPPHMPKFGSYLSSSESNALLHTKVISERFVDWRIDPARFQATPLTACSCGHLYSPNRFENRNCRKLDLNCLRRRCSHTDKSMPHLKNQGLTLIPATRHKHSLPAEQKPGHLPDIPDLNS